MLANSLHLMVNLITYKQYLLVTKNGQGMDYTYGQKLKHQTESIFTALLWRNTALSFVKLLHYGYKPQACYTQKLY